MIITEDHKFSQLSITLVKKVVAGETEKVGEYSSVLDDKLLLFRSENG